MGFVWGALPAPLAPRGAVPPVLASLALAGPYVVVCLLFAGPTSLFVCRSRGNAGIRFARATVRALSSARPQVQPTWLPFVRVQSTRDAVASARRLGGTVRLEPNPALLGGRVAVVADPTGAAIGLLEWNEAEGPPRS